MIVAGMHLVLHSIGRCCCHPETSKLSITAQPLAFDIYSAPVEVAKTLFTLSQFSSAPGLPYSSMRIAISRTARHWNSTRSMRSSSAGTP